MGRADDNHWRHANKPDLPLLLYKDYKTKPAYYDL